MAPSVSAQTSQGIPYTGVLAGCWSCPAVADPRPGSELPMDPPAADPPRHQPVAVGWLRWIRSPPRGGSDPRRRLSRGGRASRWSRFRCPRHLDAIEHSEPAKLRVRCRRARRSAGGGRHQRPAHRWPRAQAGQKWAGSAAGNARSVVTDASINARESSTGMSMMSLRETWLSNMRKTATPWPNSILRTVP